MQITVLDLEREPIEFDLALPPGSIHYGDETTQAGPLAVTGRADLIEEHRGPREIIPDIRVRAEYNGSFQILCARCLEPVENTLAGQFDLLFRPLGADQGPSDRSIGASETEIGYYQDGSLLLEDVLREQVLLSLPARTLCQPDCKGLCPRCGRNLNTETCTCDTAPADPRWSALSDLRSRIGSGPSKG
ncbi:YceD family protein [Paracidobacterium acidisoli]|uniref:DUF177 domain-containing protein n=1 Tax=Paracidobacterium acidisoli TaxID=2303751 RepID=A0A372INB5_9BACT|nr:DUF177 domain-containing protein [Paracidobacterium acidisoli]MBT9332065.1 DUF177 domain-containing protein [Paracidobacterium acidisoli]